MAKNKITEKELKTDPFLILINQLFEFYKEKKIIVQWCGVGLAACVLFIVAVTQYNAHIKRKAQLAFENASSKEQLDEYLKKYKDKRYFPLVLFKKGNLLYTEKEYKESLNPYQELLSKFPTHPLADQALLGTGYAYMALHDYDNAQQSFNKVIQDYPESAFKSDAQIQLARCLLSIGDSKKAQEIVQNLLDKEPNSLFADEAKKMLPEIKRSL